MDKQKSKFKVGDIVYVKSLKNTGIIYRTNIGVTSDNEEPWYAIAFLKSGKRYVNTTSPQSSLAYANTPNKTEWVENIQQWKSDMVLKLNDFNGSQDLNNKIDSCIKDLIAINDNYNYIASSYTALYRTWIVRIAVFFHIIQPEDFFPTFHVMDKENPPF